MAVVLIGKIRKEKGVSLNQLAKLTGISSSTLRNYENQKQSPRTKNKLKIFFILSSPFKFLYKHYEVCLMIFHYIIIF